MEVNLAAVASITINDDLVVTNLVKNFFVAQGAVSAEQAALANQAALLLAVSGLEQRVNALMNTIRVSDTVRAEVVSLSRKMGGGSLPNSIG